MAEGVSGRGPVDLDHLARLLAVARRHLRLVVGVVVVVCAAGVVYTMRATPVYESEASIRIEKERPTLPGLEVLETFTDGTEIGTEMTELASRTLAEEVTRTTALQLRLVEPHRVARALLIAAPQVDPRAPESNYVLRRAEDGRFIVRDRERDRVLGTVAVGERVELPGVSFTLKPAAAEHEELVLEVGEFGEVVKGLRKAFDIERAPREANIILIRYRDTDRGLVRDVPNALLNHFLARRLHVSQTEARSTVEFLTDQLVTLSAQLEAAEDELRRFRESRQVVSPVAEAETQLKRLADLQARHNVVETERAALGALLQEVRHTDMGAPDPTAPSPYRRLIGFPTILRNPAAAELLRSLVTVENQRAELLVRRSLDDPDVRVFSNRIAELENQLKAIAETYHEGLSKEAESLDRTLAHFADLLETIPGREMEFARLQREAIVLSELYTLLRTRLKEAEIIEAVEDPSARVVDPAIVPTEPVRPRPLLNLLGALVAGLALGLAAAILREYQDRTIRTRADVETATNLPILGLVPRIQASAALAAEPGHIRRFRVQLERWGARITGADEVEAPTQSPQKAILFERTPELAAAQAAYDRLHTNISFARPDVPVRVLVTTSALPGDGKTTSTTNLALSLARTGRKVVLVDADLHRGASHALLGVKREPGLSNILIGSVDPLEAIHEVKLEGPGTLHLIPTGKLPPNPIQMLRSSRMAPLIERLRGEYDAVFIDSPPLNLLVDASVLGALADGVLLVARAGVTPTVALELAAEHLRRTHAPVIGTLLNDVDLLRDAVYDNAYLYYGSGRYAYGTTEGTG